MILRSETLEPGSALDADLCVVGAGAAGIAVAREFLGTRFEVVVLESGGLETAPQSEELNEGEVGAAQFCGLTEGRRRLFGGTTLVWGGQCCPFDASDFEVRDWVPHSGWPIGRADLEPYYARAETLFGVRGERYDQTNWRRFGIEPPGYDERKLAPTFSVFSPKPRLGKAYRAVFARARNVRTILGATATHLQLAPEGTSLSHVEFRDARDRRATVRARAVALCTGGIETARLLLVSNDVAPQGIGNAGDLVGRFFQDHPNCVTADVETADPRRLQELHTLLFRGRTWYWPKIALASEAQRSERTLNGVAAPIFEFASPAVELLREFVRATRIGRRFPLGMKRVATLAGGAGEVLDAGFRRFALGRSPRTRPSRIALQCFIEQAPNPESRIVLGDARDRFDIPHPRVVWRLGHLERHTMRRLTAVVGEEFARLGLGRVAPLPWLATDDEWPADFTDAYHHSGTARMAPDASGGVVDCDCKVYGVAGLYVAGSAAFPTSGHANTMLTLAALSIRLADHLKTTVLA